MKPFAAAVMGATIVLAAEPQLKNCDYRDKDELKIWGKDPVVYKSCSNSCGIKFDPKAWGTESKELSKKET